MILDLKYKAFDKIIIYKRDSAKTTMDMKTAIKLLFAKNPKSLYTISMKRIYQILNKELEFFNCSTGVLDQVSVHKVFIKKLRN